MGTGISAGGGDESPAKVPAPASAPLSQPGSTASQATQTASAAAGPVVPPSASPLAHWVGRLGRLLPHPYPYILLMFLATRAVLTLAGIVSHRLIEPLHPELYLWRYSKPLWLDIWSVWDSGWYLDIAQYGYNAQFHSLLPKLVGPGQLNYAFFPLYPMMLRGLGWLIGDCPLAGVIISNVFLLLACVFLHKLVRHSDGLRAADRAVKYLLLFPVGFILSGVFTESTFLALAIMCFYFARRNGWWAAGIAGFFLALTRNVAILMVLPLLYEYLRQRSYNPLKIRPGILAIALIPLGLGAFMAYCHHLTGDWFGFVHVQSAWGRELVNPLGSLMDGLASDNLYVQFPSWFVLVVLALAVVFCRQLGLGYWMLTMLLVMVPLANTLPSVSQMPTMPRYTMAAFPLFILLARLSRDRRVDWAISAAMAGLGAMLMVFWSMGFPLVV